MKTMIGISSKTLSGARKIALLAVNQKAEDARLRHITPGNGQTQVYLEKAEEASDYVAAGYPTDLSNFPYIRVEAGVTAKSPKNVANDIIDARSEWIKISTQIEQIRMGAGQKIRSAQTADDVEKICRGAVEELAKL